MSTTNQTPASATNVGQGMIGVVSPAPNSRGDHASKPEKPYDTSNDELPATMDNTSVLIVDWDGPNDPQNPKKYVVSAKQHSCRAYSSCTVGAIDANGLQQLSYHRLLSSVQFHPL